jgi:polyhydroxyalkanoate synthesis regulator phasin
MDLKSYNEKLEQWSRAYSDQQEYSRIMEIAIKKYRKIESKDKQRIRELEQIVDIQKTEIHKTIETLSDMEKTVQWLLNKVKN